MYRSSKYRSVFLTALLTAILLPPLFAAALNCDSCGKRIRGNYVKANDRSYCNNACYEKTLPVCAACGKRCTGGHFVKDDKSYCSRECLSVTLPSCHLCNKRFQQGVIVKEPIGGDKVFCPECARLPKCFSCSMPDNCLKLDDGRDICRECNRTGVFKPELAERIFRQVRERLRNELGLATEHDIRFMLTDAATLEKNSTHYAPGQELGLFKYNYTLRSVTETRYTLTRGRQESTREYKTDERYVIMVLYGIPENKFVEVAAHELGHDWMQAYYPEIEDLKIKEGWAEYVASQANILYGREDMNRRMEQNPDPIYGEGYRFIRDYIERHGFDGLKKYFADN